ncbi:HhH-GPD family protein [Arthrobacter crystallopoietes BAB-32]|uniref:HhH-GPD family protein n=1 Tax=Arthrobacter crystallopoietes BAB-32 TaxID=1246476 RepID=N1UXE0_9MICC|nr:HhH-GPD-type base excision DNA repair protein [Arthrobacter crystallopoietes]EMY32424.1 HhH-GPD family protein [Arthrobacter crystallopoietes BAB-32]
MAELHLAGDEAADELLAENPFALLTGMLLDQQIPMEVAFAGPAKLADRLGALDPKQVAEMNPEEFLDAFRQTPAVHRFPKSMAARVQDLARVIVEDYDGDASRIWTEGDPSGAEILARLKALPGYGDQKAKIFLALLGKQRGLQAPGWQEAAGDYGRDGVAMSIADVTGPESLIAVREYKQAQKAAKKK